MVTFEKKVGNKFYKVVYVEWTYGKEPIQERRARERAQLKVEKLRERGFSARVQREVLTRYPTRGPEVFYNVLARKEGTTLDNVDWEARGILGNRL
jgi:hypothetical protein